MELKKRRYSKKQVIDILNAYKSEYDKKFEDYRAEVNALKQEIKLAEERAEKMEKKETLILSTLFNAEQTAMELKRKAELQYELEVERLKKFSKKWDDFFNQLEEKYPLYKPVKTAVSVKKESDKILKKSNAKEAIENIEKLLPKNKKEKFDPKSKIRDYIASTGDNGFNLDEVLNPGTLKLEDICKELGLIDGNE
ncbi:MAG: hypothetical protein E7347_03355 [Clostridiales bacterium]|nr:hypothetical protein [Clostridiales bacterium]